MPCRTTQVIPAQVAEKSQDRNRAPKWVRNLLKRRASPSKGTEVKYGPEPVFGPRTLEETIQLHYDMDVFGYINRDDEPEASEELLLLLDLLRQRHLEDMTNKDDYPDVEYLLDETSSIE